VVAASVSLSHYVQLCLMVILYMQQALCLVEKQNVTL
jgi:hypothetical protein